MLAEDQLDNFEYQTDDAQGRGVPFAAHIRKVNPRNTRRHRLLRRGISFGEWLDDYDAEFPDDRGLLFLCYQSSIEHQFEFVQQRRVNHPLEPTKDDGPDATIAQRFETRSVSLPGIRGGDLTLERFVITTGGEYFFQPSISALRILAGARI